MTTLPPLVLSPNLIAEERTIRVGVSGEPHVVAELEAIEATQRYDIMGAPWSDDDILTFYYKCGHTLLVPSPISLGFRKYRELIEYALIHCETPRGLFSSKHIFAIYALAGVVREAVSYLGDEPDRVWNFPRVACIPLCSEADKQLERLWL